MQTSSIAAIQPEPRKPAMSLLDSLLEAAGDAVFRVTLGGQVRAASRRIHPQGPPAPAAALDQRGGHHHEVVDARGVGGIEGRRAHSSTCPSTQVTEPPPTQMCSPSCSTCTRPARPRAVPWLAT